MINMEEIESLVLYDGSVLKFIKEKKYFIFSTLKAYRCFKINNGFAWHECGNDKIIKGKKADQLTSLLNKEDLKFILSKE